MAGMKRFVTYIYSYENREKGNNTGFARIEIRGEECRIEVYLRGLPGNTNAKVALFRVAENQMQGFPLGEMVVAGGAANFRTLLRAGKIGDSPYGIYDMEGMIVFCEDERIFMSRWSEGDSITVDKEHYRLWEKTAIEKQNEGSGPETADEKPVEEKTALQQRKTGEQQRKAGQQQTMPGQQRKTGEQQEPSAEPKETQHNGIADSQEDVIATEIPMRNIFPQYTWEEIWESLKTNHAMYAPFEDETIVCLRVELKDIRNLPKRYWYLGNNSFLLHGFFNYHYLIIGRKKEHYFLGIPGIFQHQERVMAAIFGFPEFLPTAVQKESGEEAERKEVQQYSEPLNRFGFWFRYMEE